MSHDVDSDCEEISEWPPRNSEKSSVSDESEDEENFLQDCAEDHQAEGEGQSQNIGMIRKASPPVGTIRKASLPVVTIRKASPPVVMIRKASPTVVSIRKASPPDVGPDEKRAKLCGNDGDSWEEEVPTAQVALARWWRREGRNIVVDSLPNSSNPNTRLLHVAKTESAQTFLESEMLRLRQKLNSSPGLKKAGLLSALATFYDLCGQYSQAETCLRQSLSINPASKHTKWLSAKVRKQLDAVNMQIVAAKSLGDSKKERFSFPNPTPVERVSGNSLSAAEFFERYSSTSTPVVLTDVVKDMTPSPWTIEYLRTAIGNKHAPVKRVVPGSAEWAQLESARTMGVSDFIDSLEENNTEQLYLFDWSLPINCPELSKELAIPKYFSGDLLKKAREGSLYRDSWPSLFVAPRGLSGGLHVDAFGSNFWMALFQGRKRWLFFQKEDLPLLYPRYSHSMDPTFVADVFRPDLEKYPLLSLTHPRECILQPGELLFVPAGCPHRVENLDKSLAVSGNFVDESNFEVAKEELRLNALKDPRSLDLLQQFGDMFIDKRATIR